MPKKIILLNASALRISSCKRRLHYVVIDGYKKARNSISIEFGSAFHLIPKHVYQDNDYAKGLSAAQVYFKDSNYEPDSKKKYLNDFMLSKVGFDWYTSELHKNDSFEVLRDTDGKALVEVQFAIPYYAGENVEVILCGTIDKIVVHRQSKLICEGDFKTTTSWDENEYLRGWVLNTQRYFYNIALRKMIETSSPQSILNQYVGKDVGSFVDGIFIKSSGETECKRSEVFVFTERQRSQYDHLLLTLCKWFDEHQKLITDSNGLHLPDPEGLLNDSCSENKYGSKCDFFDVCACNDSVASEHVLRRNFVQKPYDPLNRKD